ncbi:uncharacterized protein PSANT_01181 [Moesziomyces antarcticus]|uniref:Uncharacterized protein n=2 Tax=Pseudozyma antarctica TaxID=84753 RepID=A0A5C3FH92_PSEA2|nr:uncharacterized protein PSANT_01181 [Moesziomyces antarcticus]
MSKAGAVSSLTLVRQLWEYAGLPTRVLENTIRQGGLELVHDPSVYGQAVRSSFQITAVAQACTATIALAAQYYKRLIQARTKLGGEEEDVVLGPVSVDARHAVAEWKGWTRIYLDRGATGVGVGEMIRDSIASDSDEAKQVLGMDAHAVADWDSLAGLYRTRPAEAREVAGIVRIHTNFPHHKLGILQLLGLVPNSKHWTDQDIHEVFAQFQHSHLQERLDGWDAFEFERRAHERGLCVTAYRTLSEWEQSPMGEAVRRWIGENGGSPFRMSRLTASTSHTPRAHTATERLRVIDMSRVIAGPYSTRTLAAHGAEVMLISSAALPNLPLRELDTARGKRTAYAHLERGEKLPRKMRRLVEGADVVSQAYRPGGLVERGLGPGEVQALRPGVVYAELCAFGFTGPWAATRAYDSLTQTACGMNHLEGRSYCEHTGQHEVEPKALPVQALDYAAGSLLCLATLAAKCRGILEQMPATSGGEGDQQKGWHVQVSLASTAEWIKSLGQVHGEAAWETPPHHVLPVDADQLAAMASSYRVRGLKSHAQDYERQDVFVLAIRHAAVSAPDSGAEDEDDLRWSVPAHLGVDTLRWN